MPSPCRPRPLTVGLRLLSLFLSATISAYALIALLRFFITPEEFAHTKFSLGPFRKPFYLITG